MKSSTGETDVAVVAGEVLEGVVSFLRGMAALAAPSVLPACMLSVLQLLPLVALAAAVLWALCYPFHLLGVEAFTFSKVLRGTCILALLLARLLLSEASGKVFHAVVESQDPQIAKSIKAMPVINGLRAQARALLRIWAIVLIVAMALVASAPVLAHVLLPLAAAVGLMVSTASVSLLVAVPVVVVALVAVLVLAGQSFAFVAPVMWIHRRVGPFVSVTVLVTVLLGVLKGSSLRSMVETATVLYSSSSLLTQQLLANYSQRLRRDEWDDFKTKHAWRMFGFGLPIFFLCEVTPEVATMLLPAFHGAAGALLVDILTGKREFLFGKDIE